MGVGETNHFLRTGGKHACSKEGVQEEGRCKEGRQESDKEGDCKKGCKEEEVTSRTLFGARRPRRAFFVPAGFSSAYADKRKAIPPTPKNPATCSRCCLAQVVAFTLFQNSPLPA